MERETRGTETGSIISLFVPENRGKAETFLLKTRTLPFRHSVSSDCRGRGGYQRSPPGRQEGGIPNTWGIRER